MSTLEKVPKEKLLEMYRKMLLSRRFEERLIEENNNPDGRLMSMPHMGIGQEAVGIGAGAQLRKDDYIRTSVRGMPEMIGKGVDLKRLMAEHFGKVAGFSNGHGNPMHCIAVEYGMMGGDGSLGAGMPIGTGLALASKMKGTGQVTVVFFGDGTSSEGRFHEGLNFAAIWQVPVVYLCSNNLYAISTPFSKSFKVNDIASRAAGYGVPGVIVDGMDVLAVYEEVGKAVERARSGGGPTLIEAKTYRYRGHFEGDPGVYRTKEELQEWMKKDPIPNFKKKLIDAGMLTEQASEEMDEKILAELDEAVKFALESPMPPAEEAMECVWG
ncbi:thiamine pyrophosphate-dependent dehydrogenase E1 component subunit alpha [Chloroflexota bacterium]